MSIWRVCARDEIGVRVAPAPIACQNIRPALFNQAILAVPVHAAIAVIHHGAPRRGVRLSRLQTNKAHSCNSNDGDENCAHQNISLPISGRGKLPFSAIAPCSQSIPSAANACPLWVTSGPSRSAIGMSAYARPLLSNPVALAQRSRSNHGVPQTIVAILSTVAPLSFDDTERALMVLIRAGAEESELPLGRRTVE
jgi:hypothetical protein